MPDPFRIEGPAVISFSGGRTSGYMLWRVLQAHGGTLPEDVKVVFCNTGKERPETLDFVERCSIEWGVPVVWLEYRYSGPGIPSPDGTGTKKRKTPGRHSHAVVDYATASRNGEPFEAVVRARSMLPNVMVRFCTVEMKIRTSRRYLRSLGWKRWTNLIGFRADEPQRVARLRGTNRHSSEDPIAPLHEAGVTSADVMAFWASHPFDLQLKSYEGNCDLCFLKGQGKIERVMRERPDLAEWWLRMEELGKELQPRVRTPGGNLFRKDRPSYAAMLERSQRASLPMMGDDEDDQLSIACHCTD